MSSWAEPDRGKRSLVDKLGKKRLITIGAGGAALLLGLVTFIMIKYVGFDTSEMVISDGSSAAPSDPHGAFDYWTKVFRTGSSDDKHLAQCEIVERVVEIYSRVKFPQFGPGDEEDQAVRGLDYGMDRIAENEYELKLYNNLLNDFGDETVGKYQQRYRKAVAQLVSELDRIDRLSSSLRGKIAVSRMFGS